MSMPNNLLLVRHGQSTGNLATEAAKTGDLSFYTEAFTTTPDHQWALTPTGKAQAALAGAWIHEHFPEGLNRYYASPYLRTRQTAENLDLPGAGWLLNRALRERDWGDIGTCSIAEFESRPEYKLNAAKKKQDPLYWRPPGGESIAQVAEDRVRNVLATLHREQSEQNVLAVTHGETMWAFRLVLERMNDDQFVQTDADKSQKIRNCQILWYTRINPETGEQAPRLSWLLKATPVENGDTWEVQQTPWRHFEAELLTNEEIGQTG